MVDLVKEMGWYALKKCMRDMIMGRCEFDEGVWRGEKGEIEGVGDGHGEHGIGMHGERRSV